MAISKVGINQLRVPDYEELNWHVPLNENFNILAARGNLAGSNRVIEGFAATDVGNGSINIADGYIYAGDFFEISGGVYTIPTNTGRIVYIDSDNTIQISAVLPALGSLLLFYVVNTADALAISQIFTPYQAPVTRKNYIINGNFAIWQRAASQTSSGYGSDDRWYNAHAGSTKTTQRLAYPVGDYHNSYFISRTNVTSVAGAANYVNKRYRVPHVRMLSGKVLTLSFRANADASKKLAISCVQVFGSGGAANVITHLAKLSITSVFNTKYTVTFKMPSIDGKTLGSTPNYTEFIFWFDAGSDYNSQTDSMGQQSGNFNLGHIQLEDGPIATPFEYEDENSTLQRCRYFYEAGYVCGPCTQYYPEYATPQYPVFNSSKFRQPTITIGTPTFMGHDGTPGAPQIIAIYINGFYMTFQWTAGTPNRSFFAHFAWSADAEIY